MANPGRGRPGKPLREWLDDPDAEQKEPDTAGLPLFDWVETKDRPRIPPPWKKPN